MLPAVQPAKRPAAAGAAKRSGVATRTRGPLVPRRRTRSASASRMSPASSAAGGRAAGFSESIRLTSAQSVFGRSGRTDSSGAAPVSIRRAVSSSEPFQNGCQPASASQSITPTAQTSAAGSPGSPCSRSGGT